MPCEPLVLDGRVVGVICRSGRFTHLIQAHCPWCCLGEDTTVHAFREVHGGYCAPDLVCGACGQKWSADDDRRRPMAEEERDEGLELVASMLRANIRCTAPPLPSALEQPQP